MRVKGLGDGTSFFAAVVLGLTFLLVMALCWIGLSIKYAQAAEAQECSVEGAVMIEGFLKENSEAPVITIVDDEARKFLLALKEVTNGQIDLPVGPKLVFVGVDPKKGWIMIGYGPPKDGKDCVFGKMGLRGDLLVAVLEKMQAPGI